MSDNSVDPAAARTQSGGKPNAPSKAEARKQRLAEQLRENLKKRKELARSRKNEGEGGN